jgi:hypothetical protein
MPNGFEFKSGERVRPTFSANLKVRNSYGNPEKVRISYIRVVAFGTRRSVSSPTTFDRAWSFASVR